MFNNDSWLKYQEQIGLKAKELEELLISRQNDLLAKDITLDKRLWADKKRLQASTLANKMKADVTIYQKEMLRISKDGLDYAIKESAKDIVKVAENKDVVNEVSKLTMEVGLKDTQSKISTDLQMLYNNALNDFRATISSVELDNRGLFETIKQVTQNKMDKGLVVYGNGRKVSFKSYMEMSVRTSLSNNAQYNLEQSSKAAGVQFFVASSHSDCADDHRDFQGYFYLADGVQWNDDWNKYNFHPKYKYLSEVKALGFLTRPNCRHFVQPITESQLSQPTKTKELLHMPNQKGSEKKYEALVEQRSNERNIRKYKSRVENDKILLNNVKDDNERKIIESRIKTNRAYARSWSAKQKQLVNANNLTREPLRERPNIIVTDLGVRRELKKVV